MPSSKVLLTLLALGATVSSFTIPKGQADGIYYYDHSDGTHVKVRDITPVSRVDRSQTLERRDNIQTGCFSDRTVASADVQSARDILKQTCGASSTIPAGMQQYSVSNGIVAYMCNYGGDNPCASGEIDTAFDAIGGACPGQAGWWWNKDWAKSYGYDTDDQVPHICNY